MKEYKYCEGCGKRFQSNIGYCTFEYEMPEFEKHQKFCYLFHLHKVLEPTREKKRKNGYLVKNW